MSNHPPVVRPLFKPFSSTPPQKRRLWRAMNLNKLDTLASGGLWFARLDQFDDPLEGSLPIANRRGLLAHHPPIDEAWIRREYERGVLRSYALCWHMNDGDPSDHIWKKFSNASDGVAVATTPERVRAALQGITGPSGPVHFSIVQYVDHEVDAIPDYNVLEASFIVRNEFLPECEARVLIHTHGTSAYAYLYGQQGAFGPLVKAVSGSAAPGGGHELVGGHADGTALVVKIAPRQLIEEIVADARMSADNYSRIRDLVERRGLGDLLRPHV